MSIETTVLLVEAAQLPSALEDQLTKRDVFTEHAEVGALDQVLPVVVPDLTVISGKSDILAALEVLREIRPMPPLVVISDRATIRRLKEDAHPEIKGLIPQDLPVAAVAHRLATMARRSAQGEPLENKTASGAVAPASPSPKPLAAETAASVKSKEVKRGSLAPSPLAPAMDVKILDADAPQADSAKESEDTPRRTETEANKRKEAAEAAARKRKEEAAKRAKEREAEAKKRRDELEQKRKEAAEARELRAEETRKKAAERKKAADLRRKEAEEKRAEAAKRRSERPGRLSERPARPSKPPSIVPRPHQASPTSPPPPAEAEEILDELEPDELEEPSVQFPAPSEPPETSEEPARAAPKRPDDELSVVAPLPVDVRIPLSQARSQMPTIRLALLDTDLTRADSVSAALRRAGMEVLPLTPNIATTRWPMVRRFAPQGLIVDEKSMVRDAGEWVETFRGDLFLRHVPLVLIRLSRLFRDDKAGVDLEPLLQLIEPLGKEEFALLDKLAPGRQVDLKLSQVTPYRLVQMLTEQDRNTRLDCRGENDRIVWPLGPGYAGKAKLLRIGDEKVLAKLSPEDAMSWLLSHEECEVSVHEHSEPLAHASESQDSVVLLKEMTEAVGAPSRHQSVPPNPDSAPLSSGPYSNAPRITPSDIRMAAPAPNLNSMNPGSIDEAPAPTLRAEPIGYDDEEERQAPLSIPGIPDKSLQARIKDHALDAKDVAVRAWDAYQEALSPLREKIPEKPLTILSAVLPASVVILAGALLFGGGDDEKGPPSDETGKAAETQDGESPAKANAQKKKAGKQEKSPAGSKEEGAPPQEEESVEPEEDLGELWKLERNSSLPTCEKKLGPAAPKSESASRAIGYWKEARRKLMMGKSDEALEMMCLAGLYDPAGPAAEGLAEYYLGHRSLIEAERWIRLSLKADAKRRKSQELMGDIESQKGNPEEARKIWLDTMRLVGDEESKLAAISRKLMADARLATKGGDLPRAEREVRRAATLSPKSAVAAAQLADVLMLRGELPTAAAWAKQARELDPNFSGAAILSGRIAEKRDRANEARDFYRSVPVGDAMYRQAQNRLKRL